MEDLEIEEQSGSFTRPPGFKVRDMMKSQPWETGQDAAVTARVRFDSQVGWWAARTLGVPAAVDESLEAEIPVANRDAFVGWILSFGDSAEVLGPDDLRAEILERVESAMASLP